MVTAVEKAGAAVFYGVSSVAVIFLNKLMWAVPSLPLPL